MKYQYSYIVTDRHNASKRLEELNNLGAEGWHVVGEETTEKSINFLMEKVEPMFLATVEGDNKG